MTTGSHGWLATSFIPAEIIDDCMGKGAGNPDIIGGMDWLETRTPETEQPPESTETDSPETEAPETEKADETEKTQETERPQEITEAVTEAPETELPAPDKSSEYDVPGHSMLDVGDRDYAGYTVKVNDSGQGLLISEVTGSGYKGIAMLIDDPSRVYLGTTDYPGVQGLRIKEYLSRDDAIAGINASGFMDFAGQGSGGEVVGLCCSNGTISGEYVSTYGSVVLTESDHLVVGNISVWQNYEIRDGIQFGPVLVADGKAQVSGSAGYGLQPRTAIGQREDGVIIMLVIDGRDLTWSVGCTVGDMADIMLRYGAVNAACCDGGSSSVIAYNGEILNRNSSANPNYGRMLPNAFLVKKK